MVSLSNNYCSVDFSVNLSADYSQGEMMWQPNTPTTPGKQVLIAAYILPTLIYCIDCSSM